MNYNYSLIVIQKSRYDGLQWLDVENMSSLPTLRDTSIRGYMILDEKEGIAQDGDRNIEHSAEHCRMGTQPGYKVDWFSRPSYAV